MRICFLAGAHSVHTVRWVQFFVNAGHDVHVISLGTEAMEPIPGVVLHVIPRRGSKYLRFVSYAYGVKKIIKRLNPDLIHAHQVWLEGVLGAWCRKRPFVLTPWGSDVLLLPHLGFRTWFSIWAVRSANLITCDGENTVDAIIRMGVQKECIQVIRFGTDLDKFQSRPKDPKLLGRYGLGDEPVVVSLRSFKPLYDLPTLIRAIPELLNKVPRAKLLLLGDGPQRMELKIMAEDLGVADHVIFAGVVPLKEIPSHLNLADVYVSTSLSDSGLSASTSEAMASALPVVVTNTGDNEAWISDEHNGFIIATGDVTMLSERLATILTHPEKAYGMGTVGRQIISKRNNYDVEMKKMEALYVKLIGDWKRERAY